MIDHFRASVEKLESEGYQIMGTDIPGLFLVNGPNIWGAELTAGQIIDLAIQTGGEP